MGAYAGPEVVNDGLILHLDAANEQSYPGSGTTWFDLSGNGADAIADSLPNFVSTGSQSYWQFDGNNDEFRSVDLQQEYRDLFAIVNLSASAPSLSMLFGQFDNQDDSLRFDDGELRSEPDDNDWQDGSEQDVFINGVFDSTGVNIEDRWVFLRSYRSNEVDFGTNFRYEISSSFSSNGRHFEGKLALIMCYNRKLSDNEVKQNFNALRGRFGI